MNERVNIRPLLTPRAIARGVCGHLPLIIVYLAAWIATHGFPVFLSPFDGVVTLRKGLLGPRYKRYLKYIIIYPAYLVYSS